MNWTWRVSAVFFMVMALYGCASKPPASQTTVAADGKDLVTESDEPEVRRRARLRLELASGYLEQGKTKVALDEIKQSLFADPTYAPAYNLRGLIYMQLSENAMAEDSFQQALKLAPRDGDTWHNLGWLYCQQSRYKEAMKAFNTALQIPLYAAAARTWMVQGICQVRAGQPADAERSFTRSFELDASNPITIFNLSKLLTQHGDYKRALFYIRRLNNSEQANAESLWLGIRVERQLQNTEAARQLGDQLSRRFPDSKEAAAYARGAFDE